MHALRYAFDEALTSLWRGRGASLLSVITIAVALVVLGALLLITTNLDRMASEWSRAAELSVYLADDATADMRQAIESRLAPGPVVESHRYVSKDEAAQRFRETFADLAGTLDTLEANPLPASYEVRLRSETPPPALEELAAGLRNLPGVSDVRYDREWLARLEAIVRLVRGVGFVLAAVLTVGAALTVASVVRLALFSRRDEIAIMRLVGAPHAYINGPFIAEGILHGGLGAGAALMLLAGGFLAVRARYLTPLAETAGLPSVGFLPLWMCLILLVGGMAVGCLGGAIVARSSDVTES
jgi:cell division transport system permease protein